MAWAFMPPAFADYSRNQAVPVEKVLFGQVKSVRYITEYELIEDSHNGWRTFGGALVGGAIGNQFGSGSGRTITTILGAIIGSSVADKKSAPREVPIQLVELMIVTDKGQEYMVIQDFDRRMVFHSQDKIRLIYLAGGSVRVDKQM